MANASAKLIYSEAFLFLRSNRKRKGIMQKAIRGALKRAIALWRKKTLKKHFEERSPRIYPGAYKRRTDKHNKRKGHSRPMVGLTGEFRKAMLAAKPNIPKKIKRKALVKFAPHVRKGNFHGRNTFHNFPRSIKAFNRRDKKDFARWVERALKKTVTKLIHRGGARTIKRFAA